MATARFFIVLRLNALDHCLVRFHVDCSEFLRLANDLDASPALIGDHSFGRSWQLHYLQLSFIPGKEGDRAELLGSTRFRRPSWLIGVVTNHSVPAVAAPPTLAFLDVIDRRSRRLLRLLV